MILPWSFPLLRRREFRKVVIVKLIRLGDQLLVKPLLADTGLISGDQQDPIPFWIERKRDPSNAAIRFEPKFLHIRVLRVFQRVDFRTP